MRIKEWFSWHFPELNRIITDNSVYVRAVDLIKTRAHYLENSEELFPKLEELVVDPEIAKQVNEAAPISMGQDLNETDMVL
jgi:nucleolar protein 56